MQRDPARSAGSANGSCRTALVLETDHEMLLSGPWAGAPMMGSGHVLLGRTSPIFLICKMEILVPISEGGGPVGMRI